MIGARRGPAQKPLPGKLCGMSLVQVVLIVLEAEGQLAPWAFGDHGEFADGRRRIELQEAEEGLECDVANTLENPVVERLELQMILGGSYIVERSRTSAA